MREESSWAAAGAPPPEKGTASKQRSKKYFFIAILLWGVSRWGRLVLTKSCCYCRHCADLALAHLVAGLAHSAKHGGAVFELRGEDLCRQVRRELGDETIEHDGGVAHLIGETAPVEVIGLP